MSTDHGFTVAEVAARYRVGADKVRMWIKRGELQAINTAGALCGKPRYVVTADALAIFEQRRAVVTTPKAPRQRRKRVTAPDYFPD